MKHFINSALAAPNVMTVPVDPAIVAEFLPLVDGPRDESDYCSNHPRWNSDVQWIAPRRIAGFERFQSAFDRLAVAGHVSGLLDIEREVRLYSGFVVLRSRCTAPDFHLDWDKTNNEAFTLLTPITDNAAGFGLLYRTVKGGIADYDYKRGEAIILGDHFSHSTRPGDSDRPVALLSFTFGTDKMEHWPRIAATAGNQGGLVRRPDGTYIEGRGCA